MTAPITEQKLGNTSQGCNGHSSTGTVGNAIAVLSRRRLLAGMAAEGIASIGPASMQPAAATEERLPAIKALVFDVYGTCFDYWSTIVSQGEAISQKLGAEIDWQLVTREWAAYSPSFTAILKGKRAWESFAALRRTSLNEICGGMVSLASASMISPRSTQFGCGCNPGPIRGRGCSG